MAKLNHYRAGGVEKHSDGSFTLFGYIEKQRDWRRCSWT